MKKRKRPYPVIRSSYQRKKNLPGFMMKTPGPYYFGATLHYFDKQGHLKHDSKSSVAEAKKKTMTLANFNKRYGESEQESTPQKNKSKNKASKKNPSTSKVLSRELELARFIEMFG